jgi:zinc transporter 1/2/3
VAGDSHYITLFIVVVFHQFFEGIALGSRIGDLPSKTAASASPTTAAAGTAASTAVDRSPASSVTPTVSPPPPSSSLPAAAAGEKRLSLPAKLLLGLPYALVTPIGMAIGIGVLQRFNGNDRSTIIAIGTLDALSAGILVWVGLVEMLAVDWLSARGELAHAAATKVVPAGVALVVGMALMSLLGKWI